MCEPLATTLIGGKYEEHITELQSFISELYFYKP